MEYKILSGDNEEVECQLNEISEHYWIIIHNMQVCDGTVTVLIEVNGR